MTKWVRTGFETWEDIDHKKTFSENVAELVNNVFEAVENIFVFLLLFISIIGLPILLFIILVYN